MAVNDVITHTNEIINNVVGSKKTAKQLFGLVSSINESWLSLIQARVLDIIEQGEDVKETLSKTDGFFAQLKGEDWKE